MVYQHFLNSPLPLLQSSSFNTPSPRPQIFASSLSSLHQHHLPRTTPPESSWISHLSLPHIGTWWLILYQWWRIVSSLSWNHALCPLMYNITTIKVGPPRAHFISNQAIDLPRYSFLFLTFLFHLLIWLFNLLLVS